ncbi:MAG TPA: hypothetical protein VFA41_03270 [Ktedonobacteraceae bacterium]|jgi:hypothetical protein|nr:hypothetical protein [Ktedonobacteraceae bacterium]
MPGNGAEMSRWFQRLVASGFRGEVSDATIRGYLRSASQLEEVWKQVDDRVDDLLMQGIAPWDAYARMAYALAFVRACRLCVVFVQELVKVASGYGSDSSDYIPKVTYQQALALCEHFEPYLEEAIKAASNTQYVPGSYKLPLELGPRISDRSQRVPLPHLLDIMNAAQEIRRWTDGLLAKYELAVNAATIPVPQSVSLHLEEMRGELGLGDFHLRTGIAMVDQLGKGQAVGGLSEKAEDLLWEAMQSFFKVSQLLAFPAMTAQPLPAPPSSRQISPDKEHPVVKETPRPAPETEVSSLLDQVIVSPATVPQKKPVLSDSLLEQVIANPQPTSRPAPAQPEPEALDLLNQVIGSPAAAHDAHSGPQSGTDPEDQVLDMLSEITGEQQEKPS